jgi:hypothetical protein
MGVVKMLVLFPVFKTVWDVREAFGGFDSHLLPPKRK